MNEFEQNYHEVSDIRNDCEVQIPLCASSLQYLPSKSPMRTMSPFADHRDDNGRVPLGQQEVAGCAAYPLSRRFCTWGDAGVISST
jgi:hypothetical protein